jgi:Undecaprenyl-phosphate galactose phosphotransferase WbaP
MEQRYEKRLSLAGQEWLHVGRVGRSKSLWQRRVIPAILVSGDVLLAFLVWQIALTLQGLYGHGPLTDLASASLVPVVVVWVALRALVGLYPAYGFTFAEQLRRHTYSVFIALAVIAVVAIGFHVAEALSRLQVLAFFAGLLVLAPLVRYFVTLALKAVGWWGRPVVILSYKTTGTDITGILNQNWELGYQPVAIFAFHLDASAGQFGGVADQETLAGVVDFARKQGVDTAIFAMPFTRREQLVKLVSLASGYFRHVLVIPNLSGVTNSAVVARDLGGTFAVEIKYNLLNPWALRAKRVMDLCATLVGGILMLPLLLVLALLVYLESGRPIFYRDRRMGRDGSMFSCMKFRTMVPDAEGLLEQMLETDDLLRAEYLEYHKLRDDPRVTRVGRFLRRTSLDELPQLWNVLRGEMSLVGPRPYLERESKEIGLAQSEILRVPPGVTGPWQVAGRNQTSFGSRVEMDTYYVRDWSVWLDVILLARTVKVVTLGRGAY